MTETPSKWAMQKAVEVGTTPIITDDDAVLAFARALDAARSEGEAKGRRAALEEARDLADEYGLHRGMDIAPRIRALIDKETDR